MKALHRLLGVGAALSVMTVAPSALACGGCFAPVTQTAAAPVTGHRMAFAVSATRTVLWDQFEYSGSPEEFSWVLPVKPGAYLEASRDAWFESLDSVTTTQVLSPPLNCASSGFSSRGCGCGSDDESAGTANMRGSGTGPNVQVLHSGTVGPYDTVTLRSTDPDALRTWLVQNGYVIPSEVEPIIDAYVAEGFDFVALKLRPGAGIQQMTPVRVVTPGGDSSLPLRMVAAGAAASVAITLFVIAEDREAMPDIPEVTPHFDELSWNWTTSSSNYSDLRAATLAQNRGKTYLTAFARRDAFHRDFTRPDGAPAFFTIGGSGGSQTSSTLGELYFAQAAANEGRITFCGNSFASLASSALVVEGCAVGQTTACTPANSGELDSHELACEDFDDIGAAMIGMHPNSAWLTRLEMNFPTTALDADCVIGSAVAQVEVDNWHTATKHVNPPCDQAIFASRSFGSNGPGLFVLALAIGTLGGRRRSRRGRR